MRTITVVTLVLLLSGLACSCKKTAAKGATAAPEGSAPGPAAAEPGGQGQGQGRGHGQHRHRHEDRHDRATSPARLVLDVTVGDQTTTWRESDFARVAKLPGTNRDGEARDVWSLRALADTLVGKGAAVIAVTGESGRVMISPDAWADPTRTPILHTTRRGSLKFRWTDKDGAWGDTSVRDVTRLEIAKAPSP